jgi:hypothetical protein
MRAFLESYGGGRMPEECRVVARELATRAGAAAATVMALSEEQLARSGAAAMRPGDIAVGNAGFVNRDFAAMIEARWEELLAPRAVARGLE